MAPPIRLEEDVIVEMPVAEEPVSLSEDETDEDEVDEEPLVESPPVMRRATASAGDPLEPFMALSADEKIALFT
jgi:hypothetical protein